MTDDQLVLALLTSYKNRGIDLSKLLDDPIFDKLPALSKIHAIQTHAGTLHDGVSTTLSGNDYKRVLMNSLFSGVAGAVTGRSLGSALGSPNGITPGTAGLMGGIIGGAAGALTGGLSAVSSVSNRRDLKHALNVARVDPSVVNALGVLSTSHVNSESRSLRDDILDRISEKADKAIDSNMEPMIRAQDAAFIEIHNRYNNH